VHRTSSELDKNVEDAGKILWMLLNKILIECHPYLSVAVERMGRYSSTPSPLNKAVCELVFTVRMVRFPISFGQNFYAGTECRENPTSGLVTGTRSKTNERMDVV